MSIIVPAREKFTPKERIFIWEYVKDRNATKAAVKAGYSEKTAPQAATRLLKKVHIHEAILNRFEEIEKRSLITAESILNRLNELADRCMQKVPVYEKDSDGNMVPMGQWKFDATGAARALELLGKNQELFADKVKHSGSVGGGRMIFVRARDDGEE